MIINLKRHIFLVIFCLSACTVFCEELTYTQQKTNGLDIELAQVNLIVNIFDKDRIAYRFDVAEGKKLSCVETQKTLRIRQLTPMKGTLYLFVPKTMLLENCTIRTNRADISLEGVQVVHMLAMANTASVTFKECRLKNAAINLARGNLSFDKTEIVRSCAFTVTDAAVELVFPSEEAEYRLDYVHNRGTLTIAGKEYTKSPGAYGNAHAKRRIIFSGGAATAAISFTKKDTK